MKTIVQGSFKVAKHAFCSLHVDGSRRMHACTGITLRHSRQHPGESMRDIKEIQQVDDRHVYHMKEYGTSGFN